MARPMPRHEETVPVRIEEYSQQAYWLLLVAFVVAPIIVGIDKFFNLLVDWPKYLAPIFSNLSGISPIAFMKIVGVIEVIAGIFVAIKPKFGGLLVAAWLWGIIINLLLIPGYYDIVLRDFGLSLAALALARLSNNFDIA